MKSLSVLLRSPTDLIEELALIDRRFLGSSAAILGIAGDDDAAPKLRSEGYAILRHMASGYGPSLRAAIGELSHRGWPCVFAYAFDAMWLLGERVRDQVSTKLGASYELLADAWAWSIAPGSSGWPPHRGASRLLDRNTPELLNVWVALIDVPIDRACIHVVPLDVDPNYPSALDRIDAPPTSVRPLPTEADAALVWNANLLHWGGACSPQAKEPRVSCSFSLGRTDACEVYGLPPLPRSPRPVELDAMARLDLIAAQIEVYGEGQPDITPEIAEWARATTALRAGIEHFQRSTEGRKER